MRVISVVEPGHVFGIAGCAVFGRVVRVRACRDAFHGVVQGAIEEEGGSVAVCIRGAVDDAVRGRQEAFISPALHHFAGVDDEAAVDQGRFNPLAGLGQHRKARQAGLRQKRL